MSIESLFKYLYILMAGFLVTFLLTPLVRSLALRWNVVDNPGGRRLHQGVIARAGGVAVFIGFHVAAAMVFFVHWLPFSGTLDTTWYWKFVVTSSAMLLLGLVDDVWEISAVYKLVGQIIVSLCAIGMGMRMGVLLGVELPVLLDWGLSLFWFLLLINAFNLIDGLDGLAAGLAIVAALGLAGSLFFRRAPGDVLVLFALVGACLGFLRYNFHPASIFLGDSGSMFIGFTLAAISLSTSSKGPAIAMIGMPLLAMGVPLMDTLLAVWRRTVRKATKGSAAGGVSDADSDHLHHRLVARGHSQGQVALILYGIGGGFAILGTLLMVYHSLAEGIILLAFILVVYGMARHLVWIELRESGAAVLRGFAKPSHLNVGVIAYPILDVLSLLISYAIATFLARWYLDMPEPFKTLWFHHGPLNIALPILLLLWFRAYVRIWSLARISEYILMGLVTAGGVVMAYAVHSLLGLEGSLYSLIAVFYAGLASICIVGNRSFFRLVQDVMGYNSRRALTDRNDGKYVLLLGSCAGASSFLRSYAPLEVDAGHVSIVGIVDETPVLRGRIVQGYKVLGGIAELQALLDQLEVDEVIGVSKLEASARSEVLALLQEKEIPFWEWVNRLDRVMP